MLISLKKTSSFVLQIKVSVMEMTTNKQNERSIEIG